MAGKNLYYLTLNDLAAAPYPELALPVLARDGWQITLVGPNASDALYRKNLPYDVLRTVDIPLEPGLKATLAFCSAVLKGRFGSNDVLYLNSNACAAKAALLLTGPTMGKRIIYHNPDFYCPLTHPLQFRLEGITSRKADLQINVEYHRAYITQALHNIRRPMVVAPPNLPAAWPCPERSPERRREMSGAAKDAFVIMLHGGWSSLRMVDELFTALAGLPARYRLVMTGGRNETDEVSAKLDRFGLNERVLRLPRLGFNEMLAYTVNADAGVLLYRNNDLGNFFTAPGRMTEYLACGLPILASNYTGLENLVTRYQLGAAVDSTNPASIANGICQIDDACAKGGLARERLRDTFERVFSFEHWQSEVLNAVNQLGLCANDRHAVPPRFPWLPE